MKKILLLVISVLLLSGCSYKIVKEQQSQTLPADNQNNNQNLQIQANQQQVNNVDLQTKCADAAAKIFKAAGYSANNLASYTNHWNKKLGKCFILSVSYIEDSKEKDLYDVYENKQYGTFFESNATRSMGSPDCEMYPSGRLSDNVSNFQKCNSEIEFDDFVNPFMND